MTLIHFLSHTELIVVVTETIELGNLKNDDTLRVDCTLTKIIPRSTLWVQKHTLFKPLKSEIVFYVKFKN